MSILQKIVKSFEMIPIKVGIYFFLLNSVFVFFISGKYVELIPSVIWESQTIYLCLSLFSHFLFLSFIPFFFIYLPLVLNKVNPKIVCAISAFVVTLGLVVLAIDAYIFSLYRFHINSYVLEQLLGPDAGQVFEFTWMQYLMFFLLFVVLYVAELFLFRLAINLALKFSGSILITLPALWLISFAFVFLYRTLSLANGNRVVETIERHYPLALSFDTNSILSLFCDDIPQMKVDLNLTDKKYNYPKAQLKTEQSTKNLLIITLDSWRASTMDSLCSPKIHKFAKQSSLFTHHYSGSNGTRSGVFSLFYGLPGVYFKDFCNQSIPSVFMQELENQNYDIKLFPSASLRNPPLDKSLFRNYPDQCNSAIGTSAWERDENVLKNFLSYINSRDTTFAKPFFSFLFFDSLHSMIMPDGYEGPFKPAWRFAQYEKLGKNVDPTEFYNLYKNMVYYLDGIVGQILDALEENGLIDNTIVIITGDHAQEFDDNKCAYWGHNGNYSQSQLQVPFIYYDKEKTPATYTHWSSHYDVVPTLMEEIFAVKNNSADYSIGSNLFQKEDREFLLVDSYIGLGWILQNGEITNLYYDGSFQCLNSQLQEKFDSKLDTITYKKVMKQVESFYQEDSINSME